jgi:hypothetical protein
MGPLGRARSNPVKLALHKRTVGMAVSGIIAGTPDCVVRMFAQVSVRYLPSAHCDVQRLCGLYINQTGRGCD